MSLGSMRWLPHTRDTGMGGWRGGRIRPSLDVPIEFSSEAHLLSWRIEDQALRHLSKAAALRSWPIPHLEVKLRWQIEQLCT